MIYVADTETTGQEEHPEVIQLAYVSVDLVDGVRLEQRGDLVDGLFKPEYAITWGAMAVHHIIPRELRDCPPSSEAKVPEDATYLIGHNIDYDWVALGKPRVRLIDTLAIARSLWHDDGHSLGACMYRLLPNKDEARSLLRDAHDAGTDVMNTIRVFNELIKLAGVTFKDTLDLFFYSEKCRIPTRWAFGKHRGKPIKGTDRGYLEWCLKQSDMDPYVKKACMEALGR